MADVDPLAAVELERLPAQVVVADGRDEDDLGARAPGRDRLVGPLAAGRRQEGMAQDRLPRRRQPRQPHRHVRVARSEDDDAGHGEVLRGGQTADRRIIPDRTRVEDKEAANDARPTPSPGLPGAHDGGKIQQMLNIRGGATPCPPRPAPDRSGAGSSSGSARSPSAAWASPTCSPRGPPPRQTDPDTSVILFWMWGGPSQFETYDPKPDAPGEYRGPFRPIPSAVPGLDLCELFPLQARLGDKIALIRSLHHTMSAHNDGSIEVLTGKTPARPDPTSTALSDHPDFGMVASRVRGVRPDGMPRYVGIPRQPFMTRPTYLGVAHSAFATGDPSAPDFRPPALTLVGGVDGRRLVDRRGLLRQFDDLRRGLERRRGRGRRPVPGSGLPDAHQPEGGLGLRPVP